MSRYERQFFKYLNDIERRRYAYPLVLGAVSSSGGGVGTPPGGFLGYLPQTRVAYDYTEAEVASGTDTLLDNLNHIRYRLLLLEVASGVGGSGAGHVIYDDALEMPQRTNLTFVGSNITVTDNSVNDSTDIEVVVSGLISTFLGLTDTPDDYTGNAGKIVVVNQGETALEFTGQFYGNNKILRIDAGGTVAEEYDATEAGLYAAIADSDNGDTILLPPVTISISTLTGVANLSKGITIKGVSRRYSKLTSTLSSAAGSRYLFYANNVYSNILFENFTIELTNNTAQRLYAIYSYVDTTSTAHTCTIKDMNILVTSTTANGQSIGIETSNKVETNTNLVLADNCYIYTNGAKPQGAYFWCWGGVSNFDKVTVKDCFIYSEMSYQAINQVQNYGLTVDHYSSYATAVVDSCTIICKSTAGSSTSDNSYTQAINLYGRDHLVEDTLAYAEDTTTSGGYPTTTALGLGYGSTADQSFITGCQLVSKVAYDNASSQAYGLYIKPGTHIYGTFIKAGSTGASAVYGVYIDVPWGPTNIYGSYINTYNTADNTYGIYHYRGDDLNIVGSTINSETNGTAIYSTSIFSFGTINLHSVRCIGILNRAAGYLGFNIDNTSYTSLSGNITQKDVIAYVKEDGVTILQDVDTLNFIGADVTSSGRTATVTISGGVLGATSFTDLDDVPANYVGHGGKLVSVKNDETGLEFTVSSGTLGQVLVTSNDTTPEYLKDKIVAGSGLVITEINDGGDEYLLLDVISSGVVSSGGASTFLELTDTPDSYSGQTGKVVVVSSGETTLEFSSLTGRVLISEQTPTGTGTVTFSSIPATYRSLEIEYISRSTQSAAQVLINLYFNNDTTATNYRTTRHDASANTSNTVAGSNTASICSTSAGTAPAGSAGTAFIKIINYADTTFTKTAIANGTERVSATSLYRWSGGIEWESTAAITRIDLVLAAGNYDTGSKVRLYGVY